MSPQLMTRESMSVGSSTHCLCTWRDGAYEPATWRVWYDEDRYGDPRTAANLPLMGRKGGRAPASTGRGSPKHSLPCLTSIQYSHTGWCPAFNIARALGEIVALMSHCAAWLGRRRTLEPQSSPLGDASLSTDAWLRNGRH